MNKLSDWPRGLVGKKFRHSRWGSWSPVWFEEPRSGEVEPGKPPPGRYPRKPRRAEPPTPQAVPENPIDQSSPRAGQQQYSPSLRALTTIAYLLMRKTREEQAQQPPERDPDPEVCGDDPAEEQPRVSECMEGDHPLTSMEESTGQIPDEEQSEAPEDSLDQEGPWTTQGRKKKKKKNPEPTPQQKEALEGKVAAQMARLQRGETNTGGLQAAAPITDTRVFDKGRKLQLHFDGPRPRHVELWGMRLPVLEPRARLTQCGGCGRLGHLRAACTDQLACTTCKARHGKGQCPSTQNPTCPNCGNPHGAFDRRCPAYQHAKATAEIAARNGGDWSAASREASGLEPRDSVWSRGPPPTLRGRANRHGSQSGRRGDAGENNNTEEIRTGRRPKENCEAPPTPPPLGLPQRPPRRRRTRWDRPSTPAEPLPSPTQLGDTPTTGVTSADNYTLSPKVGRRAQGRRGDDEAAAARTTTNEGIPRERRSPDAREERERAPTYVGPCASESVIDLTLVTRGLRITATPAPDSGGSDHRPIIIGKPGRAPQKRCSVTNWDEYQSRLKAAAASGQPLTTKLIKEALEEFTKSISVPCFRPNPDLKWVRLRAQRRQAQRRSWRTKSTQDIVEYRRLNAKSGKRQRFPTLEARSEPNAVSTTRELTPPVALQPTQVRTREASTNTEPSAKIPKVGKPQRQKEEIYRRSYRADSQQQQRVGNDRRAADARHLC
ncbi:hypothetical protein ISCGN_023070 [Ixodes scapularis]